MLSQSEQLKNHWKLQGQALTKENLVKTYFSTNQNQIRINWYQSASISIKLHSLLKTTIYTGIVAQNLKKLWESCTSHSVKSQQRDAHLSDGNCAVCTDQLNEEMLIQICLTPPVQNLRTEISVAPSVKVFRCSYKRCDETFTSIDEKRSHEEKISMSGPGYFGKLHSGPERNVEEQGLE